MNVMTYEIYHLITGLDYLSVAADDDLVPAHLVFLESRVRLLISPMISF